MTSCLVYIAARAAQLFLTYRSCLHVQKDKHYCHILIPTLTYYTCPAHLLGTGQEVQPDHNMQQAREITTTTAGVLRLRGGGSCTSASPSLWPLTIFEESVLTE